MLADHAAHSLEIPVQDPHQQGGVNALGQRREAYQVREKHRDLLALSPGGDTAGNDDVLHHRVGSKPGEGALEPLDWPRDCPQTPNLSAPGKGSGADIPKRSARPGFPGARPDQSEPVRPLLRLTVGITLTSKTLTWSRS